MPLRESKSDSLTQALPSMGRGGRGIAYWGLLFISSLLLSAASQKGGVSVPRKSTEVGQLSPEHWALPWLWPHSLEMRQPAAPRLKPDTYQQAPLSPQKDKEASENSRQLRASS